MRIKCELNGTQKDTVYKGRYADIEYLNQDDEMYLQSFDFVPKDFRIFINFGIFRMKAEIRQDSLLHEESESDSNVDNDSLMNHMYKNLNDSKGD